MMNIKHIEIEELFGVYNYSIPIENQDISKLLILYGDNGAGKTTILEIIFNLLSSEKKSGHKTKLANIKFKKIMIILSNNIIISAYRKDNIIGNYFLYFKDEETDKIDILCNTVIEYNEYVVREGLEGDDLVYNFLDKVKELNLSIHYISDDRKIKSNLRMILDEKNDEVEILENYLDTHRFQNKTFTLNDIFLKSAIGRVEKWFKSQVSLADNMGQNEIKDIYFNLITGLLEDTPKTPIDTKVFFDKDEMLVRLEKLDKKNQEFIEYTLSVDYNLDKYIDILKKAPSINLETISNILNPYIESIETRLNAIEDTKVIIHTFVTILNEFYTSKKLSFSINNGLKIQSIYNTEEVLTPSMLSSGEKQLLLLFCNTITAREEASIFIIDEPELSLNVKWQRKLIDALLTFSSGSSIQFILASHSIELLTQYTANVSKLINKKES